MHAVTGEEMRRLDEATIERFVPGIKLMERAGKGIFDYIASYFQPVDELIVSIFLGRGNNAGDGLVIARLLAERGGKVILHYLHDPKEFSPDAAKNYERIKELRKNVTIEENFLYLADWQRKVRESMEDSDLVVDALLGTGISKPVRENYAEIIALINERQLPVVAVDIPSGVNGTTGEVMGTAVMADLTVTMGLPKLGLLFYPGKEYVGNLEVVDIGIPLEVIEQEGISVHLLDIGQALDDFPTFDPSSHKFSRGSLLLVAGSRRYAGAAILSALSALRTGCGIVYLAGPESIRTAVQSSAPEIIFLSQPETESGSLHSSALPALFEDVRFDAVAAGPGLTTDPETVALMKGLVERCTAPLLLDADGINAFERQFQSLAAASRKEDLIISPHSGELKRLTGKSVAEIPYLRIKELRAIIKDTDIVLVHKGAPTVIAHPDGRCDINAGGHPGQATAGSGDVLTGTIAGFLAQGCGAPAAARLGVYLHSRAAVLAADDFGESGMIAGDCMYALPLAMKELEDEGRFA